MQIRLATTADIPLIQRMADSIWRQYYPRIISMAQIDYMLARMYSAAQIESEMNNGHTWEIAELDGQAIGFSAIQPIGDTLKLNKLYLEIAWHGRGYGCQILKHIEERAQSERVTQIQLFVNRNNHAAVRAYRRAGFEVAEELDQPFGDFVLNDYRMVKQLLNHESRGSPEIQDPFREDS